MVQPSPITQTHGPRTEPTTTTIADLMALALGVGLAFTLEWYSGMASRLGGTTSAAPFWFVVLYYVREGLEKGLVAMIPVVIFRRVRYGGPFRPSEFLALTVGVPRLLLSFARLPALGLLTRAPGSQDLLVNVELYRLWMLTKLAVCGLAIAIAVGFRRRLSPLVAGGLLLGAWIALGPAEVFVQAGRDAILQRIQLPWAGVRLFNDLLGMPFLVLGMIPIVVALIDVLRRERPRRTWAEQATLALALLGFLAVQFIFCSRCYLDSRRSDSLSRITTHVLEVIVATVLSLILVRRWGASFGSWFGLVELTRARKEGGGHSATPMTIFQ